MISKDMRQCTIELYIKRSSTVGDDTTLNHSSPIKLKGSRSENTPKKQNGSSSHSARFLSPNRGNQIKLNVAKSNETSPKPKCKEFPIHAEKFSTQSPARSSGVTKNVSKKYVEPPCKKPKNNFLNNSYVFDEDDEGLLPIELPPDFGPTCEDEFDDDEDACNKIEFKEYTLELTVQPLSDAEIIEKIFSKQVALKKPLAGLTCYYCARVFPSKAQRKAHTEAVHEKGSTIKCPACDKIFGSEWFYKNHLKVSHEVDNEKDLKFSCEKCDHEFARPDLLAQHAALHLKPNFEINKPNLNCFKCEKLCDNLEALGAHVFNCRNPNVSFEKIMHRTCEICSKKILGNFLKFATHLKQHEIHVIQRGETVRRDLASFFLESSERYSCTKCANLSKSSTEFIGHLISAHRARIRSSDSSKPDFRCCKCKNIYQERSKLDNHSCKKS